MVLLLACVAPPAEAPFAREVLPGAPSEAHRFWGAGVVALDADGDEDLDLVAPGPHETRSFRFADGGYAEEWSIDTPFAVGGAAGDLDGDGDLDVVVGRWGPEDVLLRNVDGALAQDPAAFAIPSHSQSVSFGDVDVDGDLDLAIAGHGEVEGGEQIVVPGPSDGTRLWVNDGAGAFTDAGLAGPVRDGYAYVVGWTELDGDGLPDFLVANDYPVYIPTLAATQATGFALAEGRGLVQKAAGMGLASDDLNGDGVDDFLIPVWDRLLYLRSTAGGVWVDAAAAAGLVPPERGGAWIGWGAEWADLDLDGDLDALVAFGHLDPLAPRTAGGGSSANEAEQRFAVYRNDDGSFTEDAAAFGLDDVGVWRGFVVADLDRNGAPDLVRRDLDGDIVVDLARDPERAWVRVIPEPPARAVGAVVTLGVGGAVQRRVIHAGGTSLASGGPPEALFGLGDAAEADWVEVQFPGGATARAEAVAGEVRLRWPGAGR